MKFQKTFFLALLTLVPLFPGMGKDLIVPRLQNGEKPETLLSSGHPFQGPFFQLGTGKAAAVQTRYKIAHDSTHLYIAVEAMEPDPDRIVQKERFHDDLNIWRDNGLELNFTMDEKQLFKFMMNTRGDIADAFGLDDNLGTSTFILDTSFESHLKILSRNTGKDRWTMTFAIPLGAFNRGDSDKFPELSLMIGRCRRSGKAYENSASAPTETVSFSEVRKFQKLKFQDFNPDVYAWKLNRPSIRVFRKEKEKMAEIRTAAIHSGKQFRIGKVRTVLADRSGKETGSALSVAGAHPSRLAQFRSCLVFPKNGEYRIRQELYSGTGILLAEKSMTASLNYEPVTIRFITPWYRDAVFATMPEIPEIEAEIVLEEGIGQKLDVILTGPGSLKKTVSIAKAEKKNLIRFPFRNMPEGTYWIQAGNVRKRLRKLPYSPGEVWLDREGIVRREGKPMMPLGVMGMRDNVGEGLNCNFTFVSEFRNPEALKKWLDGCEKAGRPAMIYPYHTFPVPYTHNAWLHFTAADKQKSELTDIQKKYLKAFIGHIQGHRGYLMHFLTDEPEGRDENPEWLRKVHEYLAEIDPYHPTLTNHYGIEGMRRYAKCADISVIDIYWDYFKDNRCNMPTVTTWKYIKSASELKKCVMLIPQAFDWGHTNRFGGKSRAPTFDEMRNQICQGFLGNMKGATLFSYSTRGGQFSWQLKIGSRKVMKEFAALSNILLKTTDSAAVTVKTVGKTDYPLLTGVKRLGDQFLILAVNPSYHKVSGEFTAKFDLPAKLAVSGEKRSVVPSGNHFTDTFQPMECHLYLSEKLPADSIDLNAVRAEIRKMDQLRNKPGNVAAAGQELGRAEIADYGKGIIPKGMPRITASSTKIIQREQLGYTYFLQDGICETVQPSVWNTWSPERRDKTPWVRIDLAKPAKVRQVKIWSTVRYEGSPSPVTALHVEVLKDGAWKTVGTVKNNTKAVITVDFPVETTSAVRVVLDQINYAFSCGSILDEIEVFEQN